MLTRVCSCRLSTMINTSTALLLNTTKCTRPAAATAAFHTSRSPAAALGHLSISSSSVPSKLSYSSTSSSSTSIAAAAIHSSSHLGSNSVLLQSTAVLRVYHAGKYVAGRKSVRYYSSGASNTDRPSVNDLEGGLSSEAVGIDESAIDAIPAESMPAGANRTEGPQPGMSPEPEVNPKAGDPQPDSSRPPSGPSGPDMAYEAGEPLAGKPRTSGPEVDDSSEQQPEVQGPAAAVNPDRIPFWGS